MVIKTMEFEQTVQFFRDFGMELTEERHGSGPTHFSCVAPNGMVFEIYPSRKNDSVYFVPVGPVIDVGS